MVAAIALEIDSYDPAALATIRRSARTGIASCESLYGRRQFRSYLQRQAVDVAIIDVAWNGILESAKIAAMADACEVSLAPHNFNGHLGSLMSAHLCAAIPNFHVMEIDIEDVPWKDDVVSRPPGIEDGELVIPAGPGWGVEINEDVIRAHPPARPVKCTKSPDPDQRERVRHYTLPDTDVAALPPSSDAVPEETETMA